MINEVFNTPRPIRLFVRLPAAHVEVTTVEDGRSTVAVTGSAKLLEAIKVVLDGDRLAIAVQRKLFGGGHRYGEGVQVRVAVPANSRVDLVSAAGDALLDGSFDRIAAKSASGELRVTGEVSGDASVKTVSGEIRLERVGGDLTAHTVSGNVSTEVVAGSVSAKSVSGNVRIGSVRDGRVDLQSVSGHLEVGVASGTSLDVDAVTASGTLSSEVPLSGAKALTGGPTVVLRGKTVSGDLRLFRAA